MLNIGVIGLGNIAQKAYLPVMAQLQDQVNWVLCSRQPAKLAQLQDQYRFSNGCLSFEDLLAKSLDAVFIHTPTNTHYTLVKQALSHGLHVFVDKPLSENPLEVAELYKLAAQQGLLLTVGFNRRFVPQLQKLKSIPNKQLINVTKTRVDTRQPAAFAIYDLMIHTIDTALYLANDVGLNDNVQPYCKQDANHQLQVAQLTIETASQLITATLNMQGGTNQEIASLQSPHGLFSVDNLTQYTAKTATDNRQQQPADWEPTLVSRGFDPMIKAFITALQTNGENPVSPASSLLTHQLCHTMCRQAQRR